VSDNMKLGEIEPDRQAFEDHIRKLNPRMIFVNRWHDGQLVGQYKHCEVQSMWEGWQAALAWNRAQSSHADRQDNRPNEKE
jgi:hypothetical protein